MAGRRRGQQVGCTSNRSANVPTSLKPSRTGEGDCSAQVSRGDHCLAWQSQADRMYGSTAPRLSTHRRLRAGLHRARTRTLRWACRPRSHWTAVLGGVCLSASLAAGAGGPGRRAQGQRHSVRTPPASQLEAHGTHESSLGAEFTTHFPAHMPYSRQPINSEKTTTTTTRMRPGCARI